MAAPWRLQQCAPLCLLALRAGCLAASQTFGTAIGPIGRPGIRMCLWRWDFDCVLALWQVRCLDYALQMGADITLNSYGGLYADSYALQSAIEAADQKGQLFVTAAGNDYGASLIISMSIRLIPV
jgi:hypothetical protein